MRWEYQTIKIEAAGLLGGKIDPEEMQNILTHLGAHGWELASTFTTQFDNGRTRDAFLIFKRAAG